MKWLDKLERKYGKYAIPNLMYYVIILYIVGFVINIVAPELYTEYLALDAQAILHGQIWRIFTFIIQPPNSSYFFILFALYLYYMIGKTLEYMWGAFRFNLYFFSGMLLHVIACLLIYLIFGMNFQMGSFYLNMSLFFVYVALFPDAEFLLFFIIPIKAKWLGIIEGAYFAITIAAGFIVPVGSTLWFSLLQAGIMALPANSISALLSLLNFIIFFLGSNRNRFSPKQARRRTIYQKKVHVASQNNTHHRCAICGRTEKDDENLEFRFCSKCKGNYEYCQDHLFTHEHRK
ncbi:MAG: hypothetical protein V8S38_07485 [Lachnospiraceae bacterium]